MAKVALLSMMTLLVAAIAYLALSDMPAPTKPVIKQIPVERFFKK